MPIFTSHISASSAVTSSVFKAYGSLIPDANDGAAIGAAGNAFSDLFLAEGAVINWDSGDATLTQAGNVVTLAGATFAGTLSTAAQTNITSLGTLGSLNINDGNATNVVAIDGSGGGAINNLSIGVTTPAAGKFTTLVSTGNTTLGDASGDSLTINAQSITAVNMPTGTSNSVLLKGATGAGSPIYTDEIDSKVWAGKLVDYTGTVANNQLPVWTNGGTLEGDTKLTWDGATFAVDGDITAKQYIVSSSVTYMTQSFSSGSTIFGDSIDDTHQFTGSLYISGSATFAAPLTSLTLVTPALGTPASGVLTNATGLPIVAGTTGTLSVARGGSGVTTATGTGGIGSKLVLSNSPVLSTPNLGTPSALVLTNATALPAAQVAQGTMASGMVLVAPALGTPASGVATNLTGTAAGLTAGAVSTIAGLAPNTATTQATQGAITSAANLATVGTIGTGVWNGTKVASAYLDDDTAHLTTTQTFSGAKTFSSTLHTADVSGSSTSTGSFALIFGTLKTAAQTAITSVGQLDGVAVNALSAQSNLSVPTSGLGTMNGITIGGDTTAAGSFTTVTTSGNVSGSLTSTGSFGLLKGDGSAITGLTSAAIDTVAAMTNNYVMTATGGSAVTGESNLTFDGSVLTVTGTIAGSALKDEDNMASDSATHLASQQSIKAYVDSSITAQDLDATTDSGTIDIDLDSEALTIAGGEGIDTSASGTTITIDAEDASVTNKGVVELATSAETITGTDAARAVTPDGLNARIAEGAAGNISGSLASSGSFGHVIATTLKGDGSAITGLTSAAIDTVAAMTNNNVITATGASAVTGESNLTFDGSTLGVTGAITATTLTTTGNVLPAADNNANLGASNYRWANLYVGDLLLSNRDRRNDHGDIGNEVDGTWGDFTMQEGEDELYLLNNRSGKTYKFVLEEVTRKYPNSK